MRSLISGWRIQRRVVGALMIRELITRFGRENIGFLWIMVEPLLFAVLVGYVWRFMKGPEEHGISIVAFVVSGYIPLVMFRSGVFRAVKVFTVNGSLMYHRQVTVLDLVLVRIIIEVIGHLMAFAFIGTVLVAVGEFPIPHDLAYFFLGFILYALFTLAVCLILAPLSELSDVLEKFMPVTVYLMIPFSGTFSMNSWLAPSVREIMLYSPPVSAMELMRYGIFGNRVVPYYDILYSIEVIVVCMFIGLVLCRRVRRTLIVE